MSERIPPEILAKAFCLVPGPRKPVGRFPDFERLNFFNVNEIVPLTSVCRYWRGVAVGTSFLWSTIIDRTAADSTPLFKYYVDRCHSGPLSVTCESNPSDALLHLLQVEGYRVRALAVNCDSHWPEIKFTSLVSTPLPQLIGCAISTRRIHIKSYPTLFSGSRRLRALHLSGHLSHPTGPYPSLVSFSAENLVPQDSPATTMTAPLDDFLDLLSQAPNLKVVTFCFIGQHRGYCALKHVRLAHLESLSVLDGNKSISYMSQPSQITASILEHMSFPPSCELNLDSVLSPELEPIDRSLGRRPAPTHLRLRYNTNGSAVQIDTVDPQTASRTSIRVTVGRPRPAAGIACPTDIGTRMTGLALFANVRALWVQYRFSSEIERLFDPAHSVLRGLPRLECLLLSNYAPRAKERAPFTPIGKLVRLLEAGSRDGDQVWCPALSVVAFSIWEKPGWDSDGCMRRLIKSRAKAGCPLERLLIGEWSRTHGPGPAEDICAVHEYDGRGTALRVHRGAEAADIVQEASRWRMDGTQVLDFRSMFELYQ